MPSAPPVWIDHSDPLLRMGIASCLREASYPIVGTSNALQPHPDTDRTGVLLFELGRRLDRALEVAAGTDMALIGLRGDVATQGLRDPQGAGLAAVLPLRGLTVARLLWCLSAVTDGRRAAPREHARRRASLAGQLTDRERHILRLLADGATTRDMAEHMNYSERTVKNIVHAVLLKLQSRTRAHAVAVAARQGMI